MNVEVWMHPTPTFDAAVASLKAELGSEAPSALKALVGTYSELLKDPWTFKDSDRRSGKNLLHVFHPGYVLVYRVEADFQGEATLIRQRVYLKNILREK